VLVGSGESAFADMGREVPDKIIAGKRTRFRTGIAAAVSLPQSSHEPRHPQTLRPRIRILGGALAGEACWCTTSRRRSALHPAHADGGGVAKRTQGTLTIASTRRQGALSGAGVVDAVQTNSFPPSSTAPSCSRSIRTSASSTCVTNHDQLMTKPVWRGVLALVSGTSSPRTQGARCMRGADTIMIFKNRSVRRPTT